jgi:hypothetical protein
MFYAWETVDHVENIKETISKPEAGLGLIKKLFGAASNQMYFANIGVMYGTT